MDYYLKVENSLMIDFIEYVVKELTSKRLTKDNALSLVEQFSQNNNRQTQARIIHPLLHENTSDLNEQKYTTALSGSEFFLRDHQISTRAEDGEEQKKKILPGVAYLEMAVAALENALPKGQSGRALELRNVIWAYPIIVSATKQVNIALLTNELDTVEQLDFEVYSQESGEEVIHCQGQIGYLHKEEKIQYDIQDLKREMDGAVINSETLYTAFSKMGLLYGPAHQGIKALYKGNKQLLAKLELPQVIDSEQAAYSLNPSILDSALQSSLGLVENLTNENLKASVPFALESVRMFKPVSARSYAWVRYAEDSNESDGVTKLDIDLFGEDGEVCVQLRGFASRELAASKAVHKADGRVVENLIATPCWQENNLGSSAYNNEADHHVLLEQSIVSNSATIRKTFGNDCIHVFKSSENTVKDYSQLSQRTLNILHKLIQEGSSGKKLLQIVLTDSGSLSKVAAGLSGLLKTASLENPNFFGQIILLNSFEDFNSVSRILTQEGGQRRDNLVKYDNQVRYTFKWSENRYQEDFMSVGKSNLRENGVYLISGGLGGLGKLFARYILQSTKYSRVVITGRADLNDDIRQTLDALAQDSGRILYQSLDLCELSDVESLVVDVIEKYGRLDGVLHCAGYIVDNLLLQKTDHELNDVFAPKVIGCTNLDLATKDIELDFMVFFSSSVAVFGNTGQADYAAANGYMDQFAKYRNELVESGHRKGKSASINWSLWKDGGMRIQEDALRILEDSIGLRPMKSDSGIDIFNQCLALPGSQFLVAQGDIKKFTHTLLADETSDSKKTPKVAPSPNGNRRLESKNTRIDKGEQLETSNLLAKTQNFLSSEFSKLVKLPTHKINPESPLEDYGINSILAMNFTSQLEKTFGHLSKTLLFEYQSIADLSAYFIKLHSDKLNNLFVTDKETTEEFKQAKSETATIPDTNVDRKTESLGKRTRRQRFSENQRLTSKLLSNFSHTQNSLKEQSIAIIGISGRYPQSQNLESYWENLKLGKDCIEEVPQDRWRWQDFFSEDRLEEGKHYSKWGGFIEGVDEFDPRFFNISPREAFYIDPQERLFLQHAWMAMEDAGLTRSAMQLPRESLAAQVGVYAGVMYGEYNLSGSLASIANRVSYFLNLHGPSMTLDTMCSSSLTAIHLACQDLKYEVTDLAIAGGVNVSISPSKYTILSAGQFISSKGVCQSFGEGGDGYIPGEGVGVVILKRFTEAEKDGNNIYGVIKASALNHGGKTNGYTVPNPQAQAAVISAALKQADIHPHHISYIEAHGTGTQLGDPIEIAALSKAFTSEDKDQGSTSFECLIGSAKSNIGHCESAAGIAGLSKVLLQMKHKKIVPSLHSKVLNPHIDFDSTPFKVNQQLTDWETPKVDGEYLPRIAGLSSFGAGGANAHLIIEEYVPDVVDSQNSSAVIIALSARTRSQLLDKARDLLSYLSSEKRNEDLLSTAYTLQIGRESMLERLAIVVESYQDLKTRLTAYIDNDITEHLDTIFIGRQEQSNDAIASMSSDDDFQETINKWFSQLKLTKLANLWVSGVELDWNKLYNGISVRKVSLPGYPFAKEKYWENNLTQGPLSALKELQTEASRELLHPLVHKNQSDIFRLKYQTEFTSNEFFHEWFLEKNNATNAEAIISEYLNPLVYLEMAHAAVSISLSASQEVPSIQICNVKWGTQYEREDNKPISIELINDVDAAYLDFDIYSQSTKNGVDKNLEVVHCQGTALLNNSVQEEFNLSSLNVDIRSLISKATNQGYSNSIFSQCFQSQEYIVASVKSVDSSTNKAGKNGGLFFSEYPTLKAMSEAICLYSSKGLATSELSMPFMCQSVIFHKVSDKLNQLWLYIVKSKTKIDSNSKRELLTEADFFDVYLVDEYGKVYVEFQALTIVSQSAGSVEFNRQSYAKETNSVDNSIENVVKFGLAPLEKPKNVRLLDELEQNALMDTPKLVSKPRRLQLALKASESDDKPQLLSFDSAAKVSNHVSIGTRHTHETVNQTKPATKINKTPKQLQQELKQSLADALYLDANEIDAERSFVDLGLDSIVGVEWVNAINKQYALSISATRVYDYSNIIELSRFLEAEISSSHPVTDASVSVDTNEVPIKRNSVESFQESKKASNTDIPVLQNESIGDLKQQLKISLASALYLEVSEIDETKSFIDLGLDSIVGVEWVNSINKQFGLSISATRVYDYSNVSELSQYIKEELGKLPDAAKQVLSIKTKDESQSVSLSGGSGSKTGISDELISEKSIELNRATSFSRQLKFPVLQRRSRVNISRFNHSEQAEPTQLNVRQQADKIAIIGMSGRYPQASNLEQFWSNLLEGKNSITEIPSSRWPVEQFYDPELGKPGKIYSKWLGALDDIEYFDPLFFQISPAEAETMDPQHRLFIQEAYHAFEDAGYANELLNNTQCGVYLGIMSSEYNLLLAKDTSSNVDTTANSFAIGAARIAYYLNLKGPAIPVDTACSSSLVTIHLASQALQNHEIDMALAGGVSLYLTSDAYLGMCQAGMLSPEGQCKTFDDSANGFVPGEGVGAVILKRLRDAEQDGDSIHGVILGSAINQDGKTNGITAPSVNSQIELERKLYTKFDIDPDTISYVETHGTGTKLGDPIELEALGTVFKEKTEKKNFCALGSVKSNIGHTSGAAGVASVQKVLLSMRYNTIVPSLHVKKENILFNFKDSPFYIAKQKQAWIAESNKARRAAVSSFGFSGTNAHLVLEEYITNKQDIELPGDEKVVIPLSARTENQLNNKIEDLYRYLTYESKQKSEQKLKDISLTNVAYTLQTGRANLKYRLALVVSSLSQLERLLEEVLKDNLSKFDNAIDNLFKGTVSKEDADTEDLNTIENWIQYKSHEKLAGSWVRGANIPWQNLYNEYKPLRISLPTYPFEKQKYWVNLPSTTENSMSQQQAHREPVSYESDLGIVFVPKWHSSSISSSKPHNKESLLILLTDSVELVQYASQSFDSKKVIWINVGAKFKSQLSNTSIYNLDEPQDLQTLVTKKETEQYSSIDIIHHINSIEEDNEQDGLFNTNFVEKNLNLGVITIFDLCQGLIKQKLSSSIKILSFNQEVDSVKHSLNLALAGFFKCLVLENPKFSAKQITFKSSVQLDFKKCIQELKREFSEELWDADEICYRYSGSEDCFQRSIKYYVEDSTIADSGAAPLKQGGNYIITGGLGGLGYLIAQFLIREYSANLILVGRSTLNVEMQSQLDLLGKIKETNTTYMQADISNLDETEKLVEKVLGDYHSINGVIHSAGMNSDSFILNKTLKDFKSVLEPKITGTLNLDWATRNVELDWFILFSSVSGEMGNLGQCDYAFANHFMDNYAQFRELMVSNSERFGRALSINWPLWESGGMKISEDDIELTTLKTGMVPMPTSNGLEFFNNLLNTGYTQAIPLFGKVNQLKRYVFNDADVTLIRGQQDLGMAKIGGQELSLETEEYLKRIIGAEIKLAPELIDSDERLEVYGIDSIVIGRFNLNLNRDLGDLPKTLLYEYETINELTNYLVNDAEDALLTYFNRSRSNALMAKETSSAKFESELSQSSLTADNNRVKHKTESEAEHSIAIIGAHGYYPHSNNLDSYWNNIKQGLDLTELVPENRWDYEAFYDAEPEQAANGKIYCKWGGFLESFDQFDADFFSIGAEEASIIDPQERLFMQSVWATIEDAGYTRQELKRRFAKGKSANVGVFVGVTTNTYQLLAPEEMSKGNVVTPSAMPWSIANRVSYFYDFNGPSMPVDTACSSSLVAIHLACESLRKSECQVAIAGGVNLYLHPSKYQSLCTRRMLAMHGKNRSFGAGDDGFIPGEGVGSLLLKSLSQAVADKDNIYGVISASGYDHSGRSNGYSAPNPNSQSRLVKETLAHAQINPESITYVEGHGTGTQLGDSLEILGLSNAFSADSEQKQFCAIGSVKSNIGHSESAAGVAGVSKVLLQLKHKQLVPSIHCKEVNPNIEFTTTPFYPVRELRDWNTPGDMPRRALINSLGAGGVNACMVIEEYIDSQQTSQESEKSNSLDDTKFVVPVSAKNVESLRCSIEHLSQELNKRPELEIADITFTLQQGRESFSHRLAIVVTSKKDLLEKLNLSLTSNILESDVTSSDITNSVFFNVIEGTSSKLEQRRQQEQVIELISAEELGELAKVWVEGANVDWIKLYPSALPNRVSLPTYSFNQQRYWVTDSISTSKESNIKDTVNKLHPLLSYNSSTLRVVSFTSELSNRAYYALDHKVNGQPIFPGAGFIEIACVAGSIAAESKVHKIKDIVWTHPLNFEASAIENKNTQIFLKSIGDSTEFEITSMNQEYERVVHSEGRLFFASLQELLRQDELVDIHEIKQQLTQRLDQKLFYSKFNDNGFEYGQGFQSVSEFQCSDKLALAKLSLASSLVSQFDEYILHPCLIDGALQAVAGLIDVSESEVPYLPFALDEVELIQPLTKECYVIVESSDGEITQPSEIKKFNIKIVSEKGRLLVVMRNFYVRALLGLQSQTEKSLGQDLVKQ